MYYVYILKLDKVHYIGYTADIENRFYQHNLGKTKTTRNMGNLNLIGYFIKETKTEAIKLERRIKRDGHVEHWICHETFVKIN